MELPELDGIAIVRRRCGDHPIANFLSGSRTRLGSRPAS